MKTKFNLDRDPLDTSYINSKQDFDKVIKGYRAMKPPIWKNPWFYGPVGLASLAVILTLTFQNNIFASGNNSTLSTPLQNPKNQTPEDTPCIKPLSSETDIDFEIHPIDPSKGGEIVTAQGTVIQIDPNCLETTGNEEVVIKVREFPDQASALIAGIPMDYEKKSAFESGGMIEIRGEQNGEAINIDPKRPIKVDMALYNSGDDFNFWSMNDKTGDWTDYPCDFTEGIAKEGPSVRKPLSNQPEIRVIQEEIEICAKKVAQLQKSNENQELIPIENARKLVVEFDSRSFPELSGYKDVEFEYLLPKVQSAGNMVKFEKKIRYASEQTWNDMSVSKKGKEYLVTFKNRRENYSVPVRPVLKGFSLAQLEQKMASADKIRVEKVKVLQAEKVALLKREKALEASFKKEVAILKAEMAKASSRAAVSTNQRSESSKTATSIQNAATSFNGRANFVTSGFGIFNCDRAVPYPKIFKAAVVCVSVAGTAIRTAYAYVIDHKKNVRYTFGSRLGRNIDDMSWNNSKSTLILVDEQGDLYYKQNVNEDPLANSTIKLDYISRKDVNLKEIQKIINETAVAS